MKILITDILLRKSYDIHNIIRTRYKAWTPILLLDSTSLWNRLKSRLIYGAPIFTLRKSSYKDFEHDLLHIMSLSGDSEVVYLPVEEDTTLLFYRFIANHTIPNLFYNLPSRGIFELSRDKKKLSDFCRKNGIPIPEAFHADNLEKLRQNFRPVVIKPKIGTGASQLLYIEKPEQLKLLESVDFGNTLVQEKIGAMNEVEGGFFLYHQNRLLSFYSHKRIRTYPLQGGVSVYSKFDRNGQLKEAGGELLGKLGWSGLAMVEFMFDKKTGKHKVIEINPRLWGSIILAEFSGTAILEKYVNSCCGIPHQTKETIRENVYIRWLFPFDFFNYCVSFPKIKNFWKMSPKNTCYINWTYAQKWRRIVYMIHFNFSLLVQLARKLFKI